MENDKIIIHRQTGTLAATGAAIYNVPNPLPHAIELESLNFVADLAVTANDTNYRTLTAAKGATALVTPQLTTIGGTGNIALAAIVNLPLVASAAASRRLEPGEIHTFSATHTASGVALAGTFVAVYAPAR
jgi:hypothetical protein